MNVTAYISEINEKHNLLGGAGLHTPATDQKDDDLSGFVRLGMLKSICPPPILEHG